MSLSIAWFSQNVTWSMVTPVGADSKKTLFICSGSSPNHHETIMLIVPPWHTMTRVSSRGGHISSRNALTRV